MLTNGGEPESYDKSLQDENSSMRELAMKNEMDSLVGKSDMETDWIDSRKEVFAQKVVIQIKNEHDGSKHCKARLVVKGFQQKKGID